MATPISGIFHPLTHSIDKFFVNKKPWEIVATTIAGAVAFNFLRIILFKTEWKRLFARVILRLPPIAKEIDKELKKFKIELEEKLFAGEEKICQTLPLVGMSADEIIKEMSKVSQENWDKGQVTGAVYHNRKEIREVIVEAIKCNLPANAMHADLFPNVRKYEASIVSMTRELFKGDEWACGQVTSGGTESILLACLAARERGKDLYAIREPEMIVPSSVHASFKKAAEYFGIKLIIVPVNPKTFEADAKKMEEAITSNTVLMVGSAPCYPYGTIDPIDRLSKVVEKYEGQIGLHVDCCLGGFLLPFLQKKHHLKPFDFSLPGVTSLSADTHKYGYAPKGSSVILYRTQDWFKYQMFTHAEWQGGAMGTPTLLGSRPGFLSAAAWAVMQHMGHKGYEEAALSIVELTHKLRDEIKQIEGLEILGNPQTSVVAFRFVNDGLDMYQLKDKLKNKGWHIAELQYPPALHFCLTLVHVDQADFLPRFISDLKECIQAIRANPSAKKSGTAALYGSMQQIPTKLSWMVPHVFARFVQAYFMILSQPKARIWKKMASS
jgi:sphinganine-1-phosphate aldolase